MQKSILLILSVLGAIIMAYLTTLHFSGAEGTFCNLGENFSCDVVNKSIYSEILGIPLSILGLAYFLGVAALSLFYYKAETLKWISIASFVFLGPSLYLTGIEIFVLENICVFCELSKIIILTIGLWAWHSMGKKAYGASIFFTLIIAAVVLAGITHFSYNLGGPGDKYNEFATCLDEQGFKMYGSEGCTFCQKQKNMFGEAFENIEEIECDPRYENHQVDRCLELKIERTPTWVQEDANGNVLMQMEAGIQKFATLSEISSCPLPTEE